VVIAALGVGAYFLFFKKGGSSTPQSAAESFVAAVNAKDVNATKQLTCAAQQSSVVDLDPLSEVPAAERDQFKDVKVVVGLKDVNQTSDTAATANVSLTITGLPSGLPGLGDTSFALDFTKEDGSWKYCGEHT
jgi:hypothetical protein